MIRNLFLLILILTTVHAGAQEADLVSNGDIYHAEFNNTDALHYYKMAYESDPENFELLKKLTITANDCGEDQVEIDEQKAREYFSLSVKYVKSYILGCI